VASTVLDLRDLARSGRWRVLRPGAVGEETIERTLGVGPGGS